jgi:wobble nucleotide-excising tRNase
MQRDSILELNSALAPFIPYRQERNTSNGKLLDSEFNKSISINKTSAGLSVHKTNVNLKKHVSRYNRGSAIKLQPKSILTVASTDYKDLYSAEGFQNHSVQHPLDA